MLLKILDALGAQQTIVARAPEVPADASGVIGGTGISQTVLEPNTHRAGWLFQNRSAAPMYLLETGADAAATGPSWEVAPGAIFPPENFPLTTARVAVVGTASGAYTAREW